MIVVLSTSFGDWAPSAPLMAFLRLYGGQEADMPRELARGLSSYATNLQPKMFILPGEPVLPVDDRESAFFCGTWQGDGIYLIHNVDFPPSLSHLVTSHMRRHEEEYRRRKMMAAGAPELPSQMNELARGMAAEHARQLDAAMIERLRKAGAPERVFVGASELEKMKREIKVGPIRTETVERDGKTLFKLKQMMGFKK